MSQTGSHPETPKRPYLARIAFLAGLVATAGFAVGQDSWGQVMRQSQLAPVPRGEALAPQPARGVTAQDREMARTAWRYFETHYRPQTGFVDAVAGHASATLWDQGSYLAALLAAQALGIVDEPVVQSRVAAFLGGLERLELFEGRLPNKAFDTRSLQMVDYANTPVADGIGWSALDVARLLLALRLLEMRQPEHGPRIRALLAGWDLDAMTAEGRLWGSSRINGETRYHQEGRIGYEQYGARAAALWGLDALEAATARPILTWQRVSGVEVAVDRRRSRDFGAITPVVSEPYVLQAFETGLNGEGRLLAGRIYAAQEARAARSGQVTMVSEDHIDQAPHFLYGAVYGNGDQWPVLAEDGTNHSALRTVSLKAAVSWDALYGTPYTQTAVAGLLDLATEKGWYAGRYEVDGRVNTALTLNTNAVVLEAIHYKARGPLMP